MGEGAEFLFPSQLCIFTSIQIALGFRIPPNGREVLRADGFVGFEADDEFYLTDGSSLFHLLPRKGEGYARLAPSFSVKPKLAQTNFWCFGLLKLLRPLGVYSLHAAALAATDGAGLLLIGAPGSGKSTLAIGLIRQGWRYLSDDAVLLRDGWRGIEALPLPEEFLHRCRKISRLFRSFVGQ